MSLSARVKKLEALVTPTADLERWRQQEVERWGRILQPVWEALPEDAHPFALSEARHWLGMAFDAAERAGPDSATANEWRSWPDAYAAFVLAMPTDWRGRVVQAVAGHSNDVAATVGGWFLDVWRGHSRIPPGIPAEALERLLDVHFSKPDLHNIAMVCDGCGLGRPRRKSPPLSTWKLKPGRQAMDGKPGSPYDLPPEYFDACPGCGCAEYSWSTTTAGRWSASPLPEGSRDPAGGSGSVAAAV
jgi:hypothetical protein